MGGHENPLLREFRPTAVGSLYGKWLAVEHKGLVKVYTWRFIEMIDPLAGIPEEIARGQFIKGFKEDVKAEVHLLGPRNVDQAMELACKAQEQKISKERRNGPGPTSFKRGCSRTFSRNPSQSYRNSSLSNASINSQNPFPLSFRVDP